MVVYNPTTEYRLIDVRSSMSLNIIDIIVYWKDTFGNIHPFELRPGCSANAKLLFRRKDFSTENYTYIVSLYYIYIMSKSFENILVKDNRLGCISPKVKYQVLKGGQNIT